MATALSAWSTMPPRPSVARARVQPLPQGQGVARIGAGDERGEDMRDDRRARLGRPVGLAPAGRAVGGGDAHQHRCPGVVPPSREAERRVQGMAQHEGVHRDDAHPVLLSSLPHPTAVPAPGSVRYARRRAALAIPGGAAPGTFPRLGHR